jgi:hypothetical protein
LKEHPAPEPRRPEYPNYQRPVKTATKPPAGGQ